MKKALIIFPDEWLRYSPTVLNLRTCLQDTYTIDVIAGDNDYFGNEGLIEGVTLVSYESKTMRLQRKLGKYQQAKRKLFAKALKEHAKRNPLYDLVIAADNAGFLMASEFYEEVIYLSLEIAPGPEFDQCVERGIKHLIIQSKERLNHLIGSKDIPYTFIQNAPILEQEYPPKEEGRHILYMGNVDYRYGLEAMMEAVAGSEGYKLTLKGFCSPKFKAWMDEAFKDQFASGKFTLDVDYTAQEDLLNYMAGFDIGVTGYDLEQAKLDYNYYSSPAGKLFNYYAVGLPVIGISIDGLKSVRDYGAGVLVEEMNETTMTNALNIVADNYTSMSAASLKAGIHFNFKKGFDQFMNDIDA